ncbi:hypothetical protein V8G55_25720, partial [Salmonella enterica subsp. enterica serovar Kentucky]
ATAAAKRGHLPASTGIQSRWGLIPHDARPQ